MFFALFLQAPYIIVPQSSKSKNALVVDLGLLQLSNKCELAGASNAQGVPAVLDQMKIALTSLQVSRYKTGHGIFCAALPIHTDLADFAKV